MYYHALVKEIVKEFTKQSKEVGEAFQINIFYSETQAVFIFTKKFATDGVLEARHVFPLGSESLMDRQLTSLLPHFTGLRILMVNDISTWKPLQIQFHP